MSSKKRNGVHGCGEVRQTAPVLSPVVLRTMRRDFTTFAGRRGAEFSDEPAHYARAIGSVMESIGAGEPVDLSAAMLSDGTETAAEYILGVAEDGIQAALEARDWGRVRDLAHVAALVAEAQGE